MSNAEIAQKCIQPLVDQSYWSGNGGMGSKESEQLVTAALDKGAADARREALEAAANAVREASGRVKTAPQHASATCYLFNEIHRAVIALQGKP